MRVRTGCVWELLAELAGPEGQIRLEAQDGADLPGLGLAMESPRSMQVAMVRNGERIHPQRLDAVQEFRDPVGAVEEGVFAVGVEMNERHRRKIIGAGTHCQNSGATGDFRRCEPSSA